MSRLTLHLLGAPEVTQNGEPVSGFRSAKARALLFYVAVNDQPQPRTKLAGLFWGELPEENANANLRKTLTNLRKVAGAHLAITRETVAVEEANPPWLDVRAFERAVEGGEREVLQEAAALYRGEFLEGFYVQGAPAFEGWVRAERRRLREQVLGALLRLATLEAQRGAFAAAMEQVQRLLAMDPLREEGHRLLMALYAKNGQQARALRQYEACAAILAEELGVAPDSQTQQLMQAIREETMGPAQALERGERDPIVAVSGGARPGFLDDHEAANRGKETRFIGREPELALLDEHLTAALSGQGRIVLVRGESGRGKSALLAEFARRAEARQADLIIASGQCTAFSGAGDPYHPFREILDQLCGDVESLWRAGAMTQERARRLWLLAPATAKALVAEGQSLLRLLVAAEALLKRTRAQVVGNEPWLIRLRRLVDEEGQDRLEQGQLQTQFSAVLGRLARRRPQMLMVDDLQWADNASLDLLLHLSHHLRAQPILILVAYRPSDALLSRTARPSPTSLSPVPLLLGELKRRWGLVEIDLDGIPQAAERAFVDSLLDSEPNQFGEAFRRTFYQRTRGHPLFSIELLREMQARGDLVREQDGIWKASQELDWERLPTRVEAVIAQRLGRLDEALHDILSVASVEGEVFTAQLVARVLERDERQVLRGLAHLQKEHRLVREQAVAKLDGRRLARYCFSHILFRQYLFQDLSEAEQRLLHGRIAAALQDLYGDRTAAIVAQLAFHYAEAGLAEEAVPALLAAGDRARTQNAYQEAIDHYQRALTFLKEGNAYEEAARTLIKIGLTYHNASDFEEAYAANEEAFRLWQQVRRSKTDRSLPRAPHALRVAWRNFSGKLDPAMAKEAPRELLTQQLFSGLMRLGQDLELLPDVAYGWDVLGGGRRYLFHLRQNVQWRDGTPVRAADFEYAWKRVLDPATGSPNANNLFDVRGARSFHRGEGEADDVAIRALDDVTLEVELERISPYFPNMFFAEWSKPVPRQAIEKYGASWMAAEHIVSNGPFRLVSLQRGKSVVMARNPTYHGSFGGNVEQVQIDLRQDRLRQLEMYLNDELDVLYTFSHLPPEVQERVREAHVNEYRSGPDMATWVAGFVLSRAPFDDRRVRRAFSLATDRRLLANVVRHGLVFPATGGFLSPVHAAYSEGIALPFDPGQARRLLAEAGYADGQSLPTIEMVNGHPSLSVEADLHFLQAQWREHLGVELVWETVGDMGDFIERMGKDPPHLFYVGWTGKYTDPEEFLRETSLIWKWARWHDQDYRGLVKRARASADGRERMALFQKADRMLIEEAVLLPLLYNRTQVLVKPWVKRFAFAAIPSWFFTDVILEAH